MTQKALRQRLEPSERSRAIREKALQLFATSHYSIVTVRDIALACNVNVALIYHYFESKDHLFRAVLAYAIDRLMAGYEQLRDPREDNPASLIEAWLQAQVTMAPMVVQMVKIMADYAAMGVHDRETDAMIADFYKREQKLLQKNLERGIAMKIFRPLDAAKTARFVGRQLDGIFHASTSRGNKRIARDIAELKDFLWHFAQYAPHARKTSS